MALETVRVYAIDENDTALAGVLVRVYTSGDIYVTQNYTALVGGAAYCEFTLDGSNPPTVYHIRLSKNAVAFDGSLGDSSSTPQSISVYSPPTEAPSGTNWFEVQGQTFTRPTATDPNMCRCSGFFKTISGSVYANLDIKIHSTQSPLIVDGDLHAGSKIWGRTGADGYFEVDLIRGGEYRVFLESLETEWREITVPDAPSVNFVSLIFPTVASISYDPSSVSVAAGEYEDVTVTITDTAGNTLPFIDDDVILTVEDDAVALGSVVDGLLRITGVEAGTTEVTAVRADTSIVVKPEPVFTTLPITVT